MSEPDAANSGHVPNRGPAVFAVTAATLVLASIFVAARLVCRYFIVRNVSWDDKVMLLAWLIGFFLSFTICLGATNGLGKHDDNIDDDMWPTLRRCEYVFSVLYVSGALYMHPSHAGRHGTNVSIEPSFDGFQNQHPHLLPTTGEEYSGCAALRFVGDPDRGKPGRSRAHVHEHLPMFAGSRRLGSQ